jgi:hypothetical protein
MCLLEKVEILDELDKGIGIAVFRQHYGAKTLICFIKENEDSIRASIR